MSEERWAVLGRAGSVFFAMLVLSFFTLGIGIAINGEMSTAVNSIALPAASVLLVLVFLPLLRALGPISYGQYLRQVGLGWPESPKGRISLSVFLAIALVGGALDLLRGVQPIVEFHGESAWRSSSSYPGSPRSLKSSCCAGRCLPC
jgi:hypothetical protein